MQFIFKILFLFPLLSTFVSAQSELEKQELELNTTLLSFRKAITAEEMDTENEIFKNEIRKIKR